MPQTDMQGADAEAVPVLSVGAVFGGPEKQPWNDLVLELMNRVAFIRAGVASPLNVNVVFHVPGSILGPKFEGVRTGSFSRKDAHLMVQVALPREMPSDTATYLRVALVAAVDEAEAWAARKHGGMDLSVLHDLVRQI